MRNCYEAPADVGEMLNESLCVTCVLRGAGRELAASAHQSKRSCKNTPHHTKRKYTSFVIVAAAAAAMLSHL